MLGGGKEVRGRTERCWEEGQRGLGGGAERVGRRGGEGLGGGVERGWEEGWRGAGVCREGERMSERILATVHQPWTAKHCSCATVFLF